MTGVVFSDPLTGIVNYLVGDIAPGQSVVVSSSQALGKSFIISDGVSGSLYSGVSAKASASGVLVAYTAVKSNLNLKVTSAASLTKTGEEQNPYICIAVSFVLAAAAVTSVIIVRKRRQEL